MLMMILCKVCYKLNLSLFQVLVTQMKSVARVMKAKKVKTKKLRRLIFKSASKAFSSKISLRSEFFSGVFFFANISLRSVFYFAWDITDEVCRRRCKNCCNLGRLKCDFFVKIFTWVVKFSKNICRIFDSWFKLSLDRDIV